jgi:hypothetical protein
MIAEQHSHLKHFRHHTRVKRMNTGIKSKAIIE